MVVNKQPDNYWFNYKLLDMWNNKGQIIKGQTIKWAFITEMAWSTFSLDI